MATDNPPAEAERIPPMRLRRGPATIIYPSLDHAHQAILRFAQDGQIPEWSPPSGLQPSTTAGLGQKGEAFGFQRTIGTTELDYLERREPFARTIVLKPAADTWREWFDIQSPNAKFVTEANQLLDKVVAWHKFKAADVAMRRQGTSFLYLGLNGEPSDAEQPAPERPTELSYLRVINREDIKQLHFVTDPQSPNYGELEAITIQSRAPTISSGPETPTATYTTTQRRIHASRLKHFIEDISRRDPWGTPNLEVVYDDLQMLKNLKWAAAEAAFRLVVPPIVVEFPEIPSQGLKEEADQQMAQFQTGVRQHFTLSGGLKVSVLGGSNQIANSEWLYRILVESLASGAEMPERILRGSQAGALSSSETDERGYYAAIRSRQENWAEPLLRDLLQRLQEWGLLPAAEFEIKWRPLFPANEEQQARVQLVRAQAARLLATPAGGAAAGPEGAPFPIPGGPALPAGEPLAPLDYIQREVIRIPPEALEEEAAQDQPQEEAGGTPGETVATRRRQPAAPAAPALTPRERELARKWTLDPEPVARELTAELQAAIVEAERDLVPRLLKQLGLSVDQPLPDPDSIRRLLKVEVPREGFLEALARGLRRAWELAAEATALALGQPDAAFPVDDLEARRWLDAHALLVSESWGTETTQGIKRAVLEGLQRGEGAGQIKRRISETWSETDPLRIARTEANRAMNEARVQTFQRAGITRVRLLITEDPVTCVVCRALRARYPEGVPIEDAHLLTPPEATHPNCRCGVIPESEFLEGL